MSKADLGPNRSMRATFLGGPLDGTTRSVPTPPPSCWRLPIPPALHALVLNAADPPEDMPWDWVAVHDLVGVEMDGAGPIRTPIARYKFKRLES